MRRSFCSPFAPCARSDAHSAFLRHRQAVHARRPQRPRDVVRQVARQRTAREPQGSAQARRRHARRSHPHAGRGRVRRLMAEVQVAARWRTASRSRRPASDTCATSAAPGASARRSPLSSRALRVHLAPFFARQGARRDPPRGRRRPRRGARATRPGARRASTTTSGRSRRCSTSPRRRSAAGRPRTPARASSCPASPRPARSASSTRPSGRRSLRHVQPGDYAAIDRAFYLTAVMAGLRHGELIALRWRDVDWVAGRVRVRQNYVLGEFDTPKSRRGEPQRADGRPPRRRARPALQGARRARRRRARVPRPDHRRAARQGRRTCAATARRSRRQRWTRRTTCTGCATRSGRAWPPRACRCGCCRSGWDTATSRPRSATPTTRRASTSPI